MSEVKVAKKYRDLVTKIMPRQWVLKPITDAIRADRECVALADPVTRTLWCPPIINVTNAWLFCHECGHVKLRHFSQRLPTHEEEYQAERFAWEALKPYVKIPRRVIQDARGRVLWHLDNDRMYGHPINPGVEFWAA